MRSCHAFLEFMDVAANYSNSPGTLITLPHAFFYSGKCFMIFLLENELPRTF